MGMLPMFLTLTVLVMLTALLIIVIVGGAWGRHGPTGSMPGQGPPSPPV
jgi:hypothetical protein